MRRHLCGAVAAGVSIVAALSLSAAVSGCASTRTTSVDTGTAAGTDPAGWKQIQYRDAVLDVPAAWPVVDLSKNPRRCALFDVHAVYLGHQGPDAVCPARAFGRTDAVQLEPLDSETQEHVLPSPANSAINGQSVAIEPDGSATRSLVASFVGLGVTVTATYTADPSVATRIVHSVQRAGGVSG
jgi:hypothetical protein